LSLQSNRKPVFGQWSTPKKTHMTSMSSQPEPAGDHVKLVIGYLVLTGVN